MALFTIIAWILFWKKYCLYLCNSITQFQQNGSLDDDYIDFEGNKKCEGVSAFQLAGDDTWHIGYIEYSSKPKHYRICRADKFMRNFSNPTDIQGVNGPQHGSFMRLTKKEYKKLEKLVTK